MSRGGYRPGAGRPVGSASRKTREIADAVAGTQQTPLEVILRFMEEAANVGDADRAVKFASTAAPYIHPKLSAIEFQEVPQPPAEPRLDFTKLTTEELKTYIAIYKKASGAHEQ